MEKKKNENHGELNIAFQQFESTVKDSFILPEKIPSNRMTDAYYNLNRGKPQDKDKAMGYSDNSAKEKSKENLTDKDKINNKLIKEALKDVDLKDKNVSDNKSKYKNKSNDEKVLNFVKFGQHKDFSFFESYAREIIFQLFNYHKMFFYKYDLEKIIFKGNSKAKDNKNNESGKQESKNETHKTKDISNKRTDDINDNENTDNIEKKQNNEKEQIKQEQSNLYETKEKEHSQNKKGHKDNNNNKAFDDKKYVNNNNNEENKIEDKKEIKNDNKSKTIYKEGNNSNQQKTNTQKDKNIKFKGDFDFILPNVTKSELDTVLNNKTISPFIFHSHIKISDNYDIIGEVKEAIDGYYKNISQLKKYIKLFELLKKNERINNVLGLKKENKKIIFYVFNSTYKSFLFKMMEQTINYNKFKEIDQKYKNEYYNNIIHYYPPPDKKDNLVDLLVKSNIPYICIYLPNPVFNAKSDNKLSPTKGYFKGFSFLNRSFFYFLIIMLICICFYYFYILKIQNKNYKLEIEVQNLKSEIQLLKDIVLKNKNNVNSIVNIQ